MSKTIELREIVTKELKQACDNVYYEKANEDNIYPHIVYNFSVVVKLEARDDIQLVVDIWDKNTNSVQIEILTDLVEELLNNANLPQFNSLPTFYLELKNSIDDEDPLIKHRQLRFLIQNYYIKGE